MHVKLRRGPVNIAGYIFSVEVIFVDELLINFSNNRTIDSAAMLQLINDLLHVATSISIVDAAVVDVDVEEIEEDNPDGDDNEGGVYVEILILHREALLQ